MPDIRNQARLSFWIRACLLAAIPVIVAGGLYAGELNPDFDGSLPVIDSSASLDDYLHYAAAANPALKAAYYNWRAAEAQAGYAGAMPDPILSYGYYGEKVETRVGPQNHRLGIRQSYPWFGTLGARKKAAAETARAAYKAYQSQKAQLFYRVKTTYYEYYYLGRAIALTRDNLGLLTLWEATVRAGYRVALSEHPDLIRVQVELALLEDHLISLQAQLTPMQARLRTLVNLPDSISLSPPDAIDTPEASPDHDIIMERARTANFDLKALQHVIAKEQTEIGLAKKAYLPSFTFGVDWIETGKAISPGVPESGKDPWMVSVGINVPLWLGKNRARKSEATARYRSARENFNAAADRITVMTEEALFACEDALRKVRLYRDGLIPMAKQSLEVNYAAYRGGKIDFLSLLDSQRQLLNFELTLEKAMVDAARRWAEIEMIIAGDPGNGEAVQGNRTNGRI